MDKDAADGFFPKEPLSSSVTTSLSFGWQKGHVTIAKGRTMGSSKTAPGGGEVSLTFAPAGWQA